MLKFNRILRIEVRQLREVACVFKCNSNLRLEFARYKFPHKTFQLGPCQVPALAVLDEFKFPVFVNLIPDINGLFIHVFSVHTDTIV